MEQYVLQYLYVCSGAIQIRKEEKKESESVTENRGEYGTQVLDEQDGNKDTTEEQKASVAAATTAIELERNTPVQDSHEYLYYYYDENRSEETDEFLDDTHIVHVAPHWWWQEPMDPH